MAIIWVIRTSYTYHWATSPRAPGFTQVGLSAEDRFAQVASMSWDVHVIEVYGTMAAGATSVTCPDLVKKSGPDAGNGEFFGRRLGGCWSL